MKHLISTKSIASVAVALGAFTMASSAHAHSDVYFTIGMQQPGIYAHWAPRPVPHDDLRRWQHRNPYAGHDQQGIGRGYMPAQPRAQWQQPRFDGPNGDLDRDGIVNRRDRDRDGDGVRNRYDHLPDNPYRR